MNTATAILLLGAGATAATDIWGIVRRRLLGIPPMDFGLVGRWVGHMRTGRFRHDAIQKAEPLPGEALLGWVIHYLTGIGFAAVMLAITGRGWLQNPTLAPALLVGIASVAAPLLVMQPAMGAGMAASRTPRPNAARLQSLLTHLVFGLGLYASGLLLRAS